MSAPHFSQHKQRARGRQANDRGAIATYAAVGVVGVEALSRKATCLLFIHLESDAHKVNPCVRHWPCTTHHTHHTQRANEKRRNEKGEGEDINTAFQDITPFRTSHVPCSISRRRRRRRGPFSHVSSPRHVCFYKLM